ncbi:MAG TPA: transcription termination/antitermination NusG family protein [Pyrinomonadaceae bacterium]
MTTEDTLNWYVVHTHPFQEERTSENLRSLGLETLSPKLHVNKYNEFTGKPSRIVKSLFPTYIFARFRFNEWYHRIKFTRGVHSLICFNNHATWLDEEIVNLIRSRIGEDGFVKTTPELKAGDEVVITAGRFQKLRGVFERELPDTERVRILLKAIGFQGHVVVNRSLVSKVSREDRALLSHSPRC